jgi:hypothetical protein
VISRIFLGVTLPAVFKFSRSWCRPARVCGSGSMLMRSSRTAMVSRRALAIASGSAGFVASWSAISVSFLRG